MLEWAARRLVAPREDDLSTDRADAGARILRSAVADLDRAYRLAGLLLGDQHEAEDATQDALLRAWRSVETLRNFDGFQAWFDRILVNVCLDRLRRRAKVRLLRLGEPGTEATVQDPFRSLLDRDQVLRAMVMLDDEERIVLVLHYWADLTLEAVARRLGWPVGTVKSRLNRALTKIRNHIEPQLKAETW